MPKLPFSINNWYACTIPQMAKPDQIEINQRISAARQRLSDQLLGR